MNPVKVHPIRSESIILWGDDGNKEHTLVKGEIAKVLLSASTKGRYGQFTHIRDVTVIQGIAVLVNGMEFI